MRCCLLYPERDTTRPNHPPSSVDGNLTILSTFDPVFLVLSYLSTLPNHFVAYHDLWEIVSQQRFLLAPQTSAGRGGKRKAEDDDDDDDDATATSFSDDIVKLSQLECVRERMEQVCETQSEFSVLNAKTRLNQTS